MPDISTIWSPAAGVADWSVEGVDLATGDDLATAVLISLFTDRRADADEAVPDGSGDLRGWWGDAGRDRPLGSKLWLLSRAKRTEAVRLQARDYAEEALQWLVDDAIAASVEVEAQWQGAMLAMRIVIAEPAGGTREFNYQWAWEGLA